MSRSIRTCAGQPRERLTVDSFSSSLRLFFVYFLSSSRHRQSISRAEMRKTHAVDREVKRRSARVSLPIGGCRSDFTLKRSARQVGQHSRSSNQTTARRSPSPAPLVSQPGSRLFTEQHLAPGPTALRRFQEKSGGFELKRFASHSRTCPNAGWFSDRKKGPLSKLRVDRDVPVLSFENERNVYAEPRTWGGQDRCGRG